MADQRTWIRRGFFYGLVLAVAVLLGGLVLRLSAASQIRHLEGARDSLELVVTGGKSPDLEVATALKGTTLADMLKDQNEVCSRFGNRVLFALYGGLIASSLIGYLLFRSNPLANAKVPVADIKVPAKAAYSILVGAVLWMWILFGYSLGSALTAKARSVILAGAIDHQRFKDPQQGSAEALYRLSAVHLTERGEVVDILFAATDPMVWGLPLGGKLQYPMSYFLFFMTYALTLGLSHASVALALRQLAHGRVGWNVFGGIFAFIAVGLLVTTHYHFAHEFPELRWHELFILFWGLSVTLVWDAGIAQFIPEGAETRSKKRNDD